MQKTQCSNIAVYTEKAEWYNKEYKGNLHQEIQNVAVKDERHIHHTFTSVYIFSCGAGNVCVVQSLVRSTYNLHCIHIHCTVF